MMYPNLDYFQEEKRTKRDLEYMRSMYPGIAKQVLPYVEDECDRMEYEGSLIYDEYPDKLMLSLMCRRVCDKASGYLQSQELDFDEKENHWLRAMIDILVYDELCKRREKKRRRTKLFY